MKKLKFISASFVVTFILFVGVSAQDDIVSQWFALQKNPPQDTAETRQKTFETVWQTVKDKHFETDFNGADWDKIREVYAPQIAKTKNDDELIKLLNKMLGELKRSHNSVVGSKEILRGGSKGIADIGVTLKFIDEQAIITRVEPDSLAAEAGIRQGFIVKKIDDVAVEQIRKEAVDNQKVPYLKAQSADNSLQKKLRGEAKSKIILKYLDEKNKLQTVTIERIPMKGELTKAFGISPNFIQVDVKKLEENIGYLRFNTFLDSKKQILGALNTILDTPAIILDLRDNGGGSTSVAQSLASMFFDKITMFSKAKNRKGLELTPDGFAFPAKNNFKGKLVILINSASASASESFAAGFQELGRATIIGERTPGNLLEGTPKLLPNGGVQVYTANAPVTPKGVMIEGRGVIPDLEVNLSREILLTGGDTQLQAAIDFINKKSQ